MRIFVRNRMRPARKGESAPAAEGGWSGICRPYLADAGRVAFAAVVGFILLTAAAETVYPGLVTNWVSPGRLIGLAVIAGLLALWAADEKAVAAGHSWNQWLNRFVCCLLLAGGAWLAAWSYFAAMATDRLWLSLASASVVGITAWLVSSE